MKNQILMLFFLMTVLGSVFANNPCNLNIGKNVAETRNLGKRHYNYGEPKQSNNLTPKIHSALYPYFCINHLLADPDHCSSWSGSDKNGQKHLEFIKGSAGAYFDPNLLARIIVI